MLTIGKVADRVGIRPSAIRYYERRGIIHPSVRVANGYRVYTDDSVKMLQFVKHAQSLGITLKEIKPLLELVSLGRQPCNDVKRIARRHLNGVSQKILELQLLRDELQRLLRRKINRSKADKICPIIERTG
jgi:DNA-binding transcriptional MerR regulator